MHGGDIYRNRVELDFSVNIHPLGIPEGVRQALADAVSDSLYYPDIRYEALKHGISAMTGAGEETILCGNGASELFLAVVHAICPGKTLLPVPSFSGYEKAAAAGSGELVYYEMSETDGFCLTEEILPALTEDIDLLFLANPNNPVGNCLSADLLQRLLCHCREKGILVVLDECFIEFTEGWEERTFLNRTEEFPNLIVVRAFTKLYAIPGVRLGYLVCRNPELRTRIEEQLPEWNVSVFAQAAGRAAVQEHFYREKTAGLVADERAYLTEELRKLGIRVYPGTANYLLLYTELPLKERLLKKGILIRDCGDFRGFSKGYYRIAVKQREENRRLLDAVRKAGKAGKAGN